MAGGGTEVRKPQGRLPSLPSSSRDEDRFNRRIEFHPARKPFSGFAVSGGDFHIETLNPSSEPRRAAPSEGPAGPSTVASGKRLGGGLDPELCFEMTFRRIGAGLANLGNTCFLNSVLQCLTYTEPFAAYLESGKHKSSCRTAGFCALCALQNHVVDALQSTGKILRPFHLVKNLRCISRDFRNSRQEDAHEYMINLLESMHKCCLPTWVANESPSAYEKSLVHKIFGGCLRSQVKCMQCSYCSNKFDPFLDLSLEIVRADTLCKALSHFTAEEQLDGGERQYQCQQCKQKVRALKQLTIHKAPNVLTIHLKRFGSDMHGQKIDKKVEFGPILDLKPYVNDPLEGDVKYTLYGVLVHAGYGTHSGHYYCFVRTSSGMWHSLDDHQVCHVSEKTVLQQKAYMLFYLRDIRSSAPKRAHDAVYNGNNRLVNAHGKKDLSVSFDLREVIQDHSKYKGSTMSECYAAISKTDVGPHDESMTLQRISMAEHMLKKVSSAPTNGFVAKTQQSAVLEGHVLHSLSDISSEQKTSRIGSLPKATGQHLAAEGLVHMASSKDNINQLLANDDVQNMNMKANGASCNVVRSLDPEQATSSNQSLAVGSTDGRRLTKIEHQTKDAMVSEVKSNGQVAEKFYENALGEADQVDASGKDGTSRDSAEIESMKHNNSQKVVMKQKSAKSSYARNMFFGSRRLFLVSLRLQKRKICRRSKKWRLSMKDNRKAGILEENGQGDEGTSTSATVNTVDADSVHSSKQRSHHRLGREGFCGAGGVNHLGSDSANAKDADVGGNDVNVSSGLVRGLSSEVSQLSTGNNGSSVCSTVERSLCLEVGQPSTGEGSTFNKNSFQNGPLNLLTGGFWKLSVPKWDGIELPPGIKDIDDEPRTIGYILDEWEKEEHRGKRKKVKSTKRQFAGGNPFEEIARERVQKKMKMERTDSGNRPFRIST